LVALAVDSAGHSAALAAQVPEGPVLQVLARRAVQADLLL
jgi:hypothetical protein